MICLLIKREENNIFSKKIRKLLIIINDLRIDLHIEMNKSRKKVRQRNRRIAIIILIIIFDNIEYQMTK